MVNEGNTVLYMYMWYLWASQRLQLLEQVGFGQSNFSPQPVIIPPGALQLLQREAANIRVTIQTSRNEVISTHLLISPFLFQHFSFLINDLEMLHYTKAANKVHRCSTQQSQSILTSRGRRIILARHSEAYFADSSLSWR